MTSCASTLSFKEYALAEIALKEAQDLEAQKNDKVNYIKANSYFLKAKVALQTKRYDEANKLFKKSRFYAEKAEMFSYLKRSMNSEEVLY